MTLIESILTNNPCYKEGKKIEVQGLMLEGVRCPQPSARVLVHNWNRENCDNKCVHAFIDANDGTVFQTLPWNHKGRHCGRHPRTKMSANNTHIGIKMCEPSQIRYKSKNEIILAGNRELAIDAVNKAYNSAVKLFAQLCKEFELDPKTAIISQKEGYEQGIAALHNDPEILWKALGLNYSMEGFRQDVMLKMGEKRAVDTLAETDFSNPAPVSSEVESIVEVIEEPTSEPQVVMNPMVEEIVPPASDPEVVEIVTPVPEQPEFQKVKIDVDNLRIRSTPGIGNNTTGKFTGKGIFEITEIQNGSGSKTGWGKLRNGAGWICLDFCKLL